MALFETEALILRTYNLAEADKIVVCLSRSAGLIRGVAKGCRKLKNRFGASLEPFTLINLTYYEKEHQELVSFRQTEILKSRFNLSSNAPILTGFSYMGDLLIDFSPPHQVNDNLYRMALACFEAVSETPDDLDSVLRYFEVWLLKLEGFIPDLRHAQTASRPFGAEAVYLGTIWRSVVPNAAMGRCCSFKATSFTFKYDGETAAGKVCGRCEGSTETYKTRDG